MKNKEIMVSVCCLVYNHEKYLRQCLDGFMMQKTDFPFEVLIHDDASTDKSASIIKEYESKYPDIIKPVYQNENQYSKRVPIGWKYLYPNAKGKYIALCEGDDYWTDELKLQKQFNALQSAPDAVMCVHKVRGVKEDGTILDIVYPEKNNDDIDYHLSSFEWTKLLMHMAYPFQTSSYFFRTDSMIPIINHRDNTDEYYDMRPDFMKVAPVGDTPLMLYCCTKGNLVYIQEEMSAYRTFSYGSWSARIIDDNDKYSSMKQSYINMLHSYNKYTNYLYSGLINNTCLRIEFDLQLRNKEFRSLLKQRYRSIFNERSTKEKILYIACAITPKAYDMYLLYRKKRAMRNLR